MPRFPRLSACGAACALPMLLLPARQDPAPAEPRWEDAVARVYALISGPAGQARDWEAFQAMFAEGANLMISLPAPDGASRLIVLTPQDYVQRSGARIEAAGFTERELGRRAERFGNLVHVFSAYEGRTTLDGREEVLRGVNSFQLVRVAEGWRVANLVWEQERPDNPLPADFSAPARAPVPPADREGA
jgi:hypothetical protein